MPACPGESPERLSRDTLKLGLAASDGEPDPATPGELRTVLGARAGTVPAEARPGGAVPRRFDPDVAHPARVYGYWLGGCFL
jgi:hypothetical protein